MKALTILAMLALAAGVLADSAHAQTVSLARAVSPPIVARLTTDYPAGTEHIVPIGTIITKATIAPAANAQPAASSATVADSISPANPRAATVEGMTRVVNQLVKDHAPGSTQRLRAGKVIDVTAMIDTDKSVAAWHSVNVKASYDTRPIGGILNIRVGLAPVFGGIGAAVRTVDYREFAEAVDTFDDDFIAKTISRLTKELGAEYTAK